MGRVMKDHSVAVINTLVISRKIEEAADLAAQLQPRLVAENIDYHAISDDAQPWLDFARAWVKAADPLDRPEIASWLVNTSVADMAYLDAQAEAAILLAQTTREARARLADLLDEAMMLTSGPDAGLSDEGAKEYSDAATALRSVTLP